MNVITKPLTIIVLVLNCFCLKAQFELNGDATEISAGTFQLTPDLMWKNGAVWYQVRQDISEPFNVSGSMYFGDSDLGADGMVFVMQNNCLSAGSSGAGIGYENMPGSSIGVEFDIFQNIGGITNDPSYDHLALHLNGSIDHNNNLFGPVQIHETKTNVEDDIWYSYEINYEPSTNILEVYFDGSLRMSQVIDLENTVFDGNPYVYWGFTSATGGSTADHQITVAPSTTRPVQDTTICTGSTTVTLPELLGQNQVFNKVSASSSEEAAVFRSDQAFDGNLSTRWASQSGDPEWVSIDLGTPIDIDSVILYWEGAFGLEYFIQTSDDNVTWTDQFHETAGNGGTDLIVFGSSVTTQYVRMLGVQRGTPYGYSLYEFEVYGTGSYLWSPDDGTIDDVSSRTPTFTPLSTTIYKVEIPDACIGSIDFDYTVMVDCILPIELVNFYGEKTDVGVNTLNWVTALEINNDYFEIQRSKDLNEWNVVGKVDGKGSSKELQDYVFEDDKIDEQGYYYRLKQVDNDGSSEYSTIIFVANSKGEIDIKIFPNPVKDKINIIGLDKIEVDQLIITDVNGRVVMKDIKGLNTSSEYISIDVSGLVAGEYVVSIGPKNILFTKE